MWMIKNFSVIFFNIILNLNIISAINMKQFDESLENMRGACAPKFKVSTEQLDNLRSGIFDDNNNEIKCYTRCIAQLAGTLTKKGDINPVRAFGQIDILIPPELQEDSRAALKNCIDTQHNYKTSCDKVYYVTKCAQNFNPAKFKFP